MGEGWNKDKCRTIEAAMTAMLLFWFALAVMFGC